MSGALLETQPQGGQAVEGETLVLVCSVVEGTGDTTFSWYREDMEESLGRKSRRSQRAELEIPVIWESHAGFYYCTADNGHGPQYGEPVGLSVVGKPWIPASDSSLSQIPLIPTPLKICVDLPVFHPNQPMPSHRTSSPWAWYTSFHYFNQTLE